MSKISYIFPNISGPDAYFSKPIFALKPWVQVGRFENHKPYIGVLESKNLKKNTSYYRVHGTQNNRHESRV